MKFTALLLALLAQPAAPPPTVHVYEILSPATDRWAENVRIPRQASVRRAEVRITATSEITLLAESVAPHAHPPRSTVFGASATLVRAEGLMLRSTARARADVRTLGDGLIDWQGPAGARELARRERADAADMDPARFVGTGIATVEVTGAQQVATTAKGNPNTLRGWIARTRVRVEVTLWP